MLQSYPICCSAVQLSVNPSNLQKISKLTIYIHVGSRLITFYRICNISRRFFYNLVTIIQCLRATQSRNLLNGFVGEKKVQGFSLLLTQDFKWYKSEWQWKHPIRNLFYKLIVFSEMILSGNSCLPLGRDWFNPVYLVSWTLTVQLWT